MESLKGYVDRIMFQNEENGYCVLRVLVDERSDINRIEELSILKEQGPCLVELVMEPGTFAYPKTCLGEPVYNQQPYAPEKLYKELLSV